MAGPRPDTWMPLFWGDYTRDTGHLNNALHGAYLMLIKHYWCSAKMLPDDDNQLWRIACCDSKREWLKIRPIIEAFFHVQDGRWIHKRIDEELERAVTNMEKRSKAGKIAAAKKYESDANRIRNGVQTNGTSASPSQVKEILASTAKGMVGASRRGPDYRDPAQRKARWEQKIMEELNRRFPPAEAERIILAYMEEEPWAIGKFEEINAEIKVRAARGAA